MPISEAERAYLTDISALSADEQGREVFVGLTYEETEEYLRLLEDRGENPETLDRFFELSDKHEAMRVQVVMAEAEARRAGATH